MSLNPLTVWVLLMVVFLVGEGLTAGLTSIWFAGGAAGAAVAAALGGGLVVQLAVFLVVSLALLLLTRPAAVRLLKKNQEKTNVDSLVGKTAVVVKEIDNLAQTGQVRINDIEWSARSEGDNIHISSGTVVEVLKVQGVKLIVRETGREA